MEIADNCGAFVGLGGFVDWVIRVCLEFRRWKRERFWALSISIFFLTMPVFLGGDEIFLLIFFCFFFFQSNDPKVEEFRRNEEYEINR